MENYPEGFGEMNSYGTRVFEDDPVSPIYEPPTE